LGEEGNEGVPLTICNALTNLTNDLLAFKHLHRPRIIYCKCFMNAQMEEEINERGGEVEVEFIL
jgi:hypothetical protein